MPFEGDLKMRVIGLGGQMFVPRVDPGTVILGVVQRGQETGALVRLADGQYLQVNGDVRQLLNTTQVELALYAAGISATANGVGSSSGPTVRVKRRRNVERP